MIFVICAQVHEFYKMILGGHYEILVDSTAV